jgi:membrane-associated phospholipid phosphatase
LSTSAVTSSILFPVDSPFYLLKPLDKPLSDQIFFQLVHLVSGHAGARGGAFPSLHVSATIVLWLAAWKWQRRVAGFLAPIVVGLILSTVFGRFHYVLDVIAGAALAAVLSATAFLSRRTQPQALHEGTVVTDRDCSPV